MMRPYLAKTVDDLARLFEANSDNIKVVSALEDELMHRSVPRARQLLEKVVKQKKRLKSTVVQGTIVQPRERSVQGSAEEDIILGPVGERVFEMPQMKTRKVDASEKARLGALYEGMRIKLLDLTKRNRMLSYPLKARAKTQVQVVDEVLEESYKLLVSGTPMTIAALEDPDLHPEDEKTDDFLSALQHAKVADAQYVRELEELVAEGRDDDFSVQRLEMGLRDRLRTKLGMPSRPRRKDIDRNAHARKLGINPSVDLDAIASSRKHTDRELQTLRYPDELEAVMEKIVEQARLAEQEAGLSTLFLTFGFLEWYESDSSDKPLYAPLLMLPVSAGATRVHGKPVYSVSTSEEQAEVNVSLMKFMDKQFGRTMPDFETEEDQELSVESYLAEVTKAIDGLKRWRVRRWMVLGHFAFSRIAIYEDTNIEKWRVHPAEHSLIGSILSGYEEGEIADGLNTSPPDYEIDNFDIEKLAPVLVQDADASQHSALIDIMKGKNLVVHGPPGTGKSQTIANAIANILYAGKTVLFLSDKQAALDVVKRRLDRTGIGSFCLELHSDKASPRTVVDSLHERAKVEPVRWPSTVSLDQLNHYRKELNTYLEELHFEDEEGETLFNFIWKSIRLQAANPEVVRELRDLKLSDDLTNSVALQRELRYQLEEYASATQRYEDSYGSPAKSPWLKVQPRQIAPYEQEELFAVLSDIRRTAARLDDLQVDALAHGIPTLDDLSHVSSLVDALPTCPDLDVFRMLMDKRPDHVDAAVKARVEYLKADSAARAFPADTGVADAHLALAEQLVKLVSIADANMKPKDFYQQSRQALESAKSALELLEEFKAVSGPLGIRPSDPVAHVRFAAFLCRVAQKLPHNTQHIFAHPEIDAVVLERGVAMRNALIENEQQIFGYFSSLKRNSMPAKAEVQELHETLAKSGLGRIFQVLGAARSLAERTVRGWGPTLPQQDMPSALKLLLTHLDQLAEFEAANAALCGAAWAGLDTPFEEMALANEVRLLLKRGAGDVPVVNSLVEKFCTLSNEQLVAFRSMERAGRELDAFLTTLPTSNQTVMELVTKLQRTKTDLEKVLSVDRDRRLAWSNLSIRDLAAVSLHRKAQAEAVTEMERVDLRSFVEEHVQTPADANKFEGVRQWFSFIESNAMPSRVKDELLSERYEAFVETLEGLTSRYGELQGRYLDLLRKAAELGLNSLSKISAEDLLKTVAELQDHQASLNDWLALRRLRGQLVSAGLDEFMLQVERLEVSSAQLTELFDAVVSRQKVVVTRKNSSSLGNVTGSELEGKREAFAKRDREKLAEDRNKIIYTLLNRQAPAGNRAGPRSTWTDMALLRNEFQKQKRFTPVRGLLNRAGSAVLALKPCFMMSPLSLAKFLPAGALHFDVLVIDEASQMRPEDALGAMMRASQIVVVGDRKQLPPTNFFERNDNDNQIDEDDEDVIDDESILERCQKVFNEVRSLKWHYRSRCESLIRFSNDNFYGKELITFPAAKPSAFSVDLVRVNGHYQARRNLAEAERIAEEAVQFMHNFAKEEEATIPTLGIVSVNTDQRDLIQETLHRLTANDALVDEYLQKVRAKGEPLFVKNLENVQGDERDFVFISMTYGPAPGSTNVLQRFGPINSAHGHRRLNVLFSRARVRIALFTSFGSVDVKPSETSRQGVRILKSYLEYAESRGRSAVEGIGGEADSDFEIEVANRLKDRGYQVDLQVGVTGFRIDIGVRHPDNPETFLAGVECDGARYHSSKSARDRDRLREDVLRGLGWDLVRVWSTDWFDNPTRETDRLIRKLDDLRRKSAKAAEDYVIRSYVSEVEKEPKAAVEDNAHAQDVPDTRHQEDEHRASMAVSKPVQLTFDALAVSPADGSKLFSMTGKLSEEEARAALTWYREAKISGVVENWEPQRSILRDSMIECFIKQKIDSPDSWFIRVPQYLRQGTDPTEKRLYLEDICDVIARIA
ncbi:MAG: DUF4011 domain-containing protein [Rhizobiaceae bacterium]|nr:DUF4011 domain-containing protein [Rhizobiaceae bacterium]MCZ8352672.1 DUF4011 domain-containing protein [Rhizobium sp.]